MAVEAAGRQPWPQFTPQEVDWSLCLARTWSGGKGGQCHSKPASDEGLQLCNMHLQVRQRSGWMGCIDEAPPAPKLEEFKRAAGQRKRQPLKRRRLTTKSPSPLPAKSRRKSSSRRSESRTRQPDDTRQRIKHMLAFLNDVDDLPKSCLRMLKVGGPWSLQSPLGERHEYQESMIVSLANLLAREEKKRAVAVEKREAELSELDAKQKMAAADAEAAGFQVRAKIDARNMQEEVCQSLKDDIKVSKASLQAAEKKQQALAEEHKQDQAKKLDVEKLIEEAWEPLKVGCFEGSQSERNRMIRSLTQVFKKTIVGEAFLIMMSFALKAKPEVRTDLQSEVFPWGERALKKYIDELGEKLANVEVEAASRASAVAGAQGTLDLATEALQMGLNKLEVADEEVKQAELHLKEMEAILASLATERELPATVLENVLAQLQDFQKVVAEFELLKKRSSQVGQDVPLPDQEAPLPGALADDEVQPHRGASSSAAPGDITDAHADAKTTSSRRSKGLTASASSSQA